MSSKVIYERFLWFHGRVRRGQYPNAATLAREFGIPVKTAQRDIEYFRDRLCAPLVYDRSRRGYAYKDESNELSATWLDADDLIDLLVSFGLASTVPESGMKEGMKTLKEQCPTLYTHEASIGLEQLSGKAPVMNAGRSAINGRVFRWVFDALLADSPLTIDYRPPHCGESTRRDVLPLHLLYCTLKGGLRDFVLSRIFSIEPCVREIAVPLGVHTIREYLRSSYCIMSSSKVMEICICFAPGAAPWIEEQAWHPEQRIEHGPDGSLMLKFPVADSRESRREGLKIGSQAEAVSPQELRNEALEKIGKTKNLYA